MIEVKFDEKLISELDLIQGISKATYLSIKKNVEAVCRKMLMEEAEKAYLQGDDSTYIHFKLDVECNKDFADYLGISPQGEKYVCMLRHTEDFGAVFVIDAKGFIFAQHFIYGESAVFDAYRTFDGHLHEQVDMIDEIDLNEIF